MIKNKISIIIGSVLGLKSATVYEISFEQLMVSSKERFELLNIHHDTIIKSAIHPDTISNDYGKGSDVFGMTTFYLLAGEVKAAVFVLGCDDDDSLGLTKQYVALLHELGHVSDMENQINFGEPGEIVNAIKAEGYAEVFALKHLDRDKQDLVDNFVKGVYAQAILDRVKENDFYMGVHKEITKYFREKRLKRWAKND